MKRGLDSMFSKKSFYIVLGLLVFGIVAGAVYAVEYHYADEIFVNIEGVDDPMTLQEAIDEGEIGGVEDGDIEVDDSDKVKKVARTSYATCLLMKDGKVKCTGHNGVGQVGIGTRPSGSTYHFRTVALGDWIEATNIHGMGRSFFIEYEDNSGQTRLMAWGRNSHGGLGVGDTNHKYVPTRVLGGLLNLKQFAVSDNSRNHGKQQHRCALLDDGKVRCWGYNARGQVGDGSTTQRTTPRYVINEDGEHLENVERVFVGGYYTYGYSCALVREDTEDLVPYCWGSNSHGQLGIAQNEHRNYASRIYLPSGLANKNFVNMSLTGQAYPTTCAVVGSEDREERDREVWCWGRNNRGQVGNGETGTNEYKPQNVDVPNARYTRNVFTERDLSCAIVFAGDVYCWGRSSRGSRGDGTCTTNHGYPEQVMYGSGSGYRLRRVTDLQIISGGGGYTSVCALIHPDDHFNGGHVYCWGDNARGQLGRGYSGTSCGSNDVEYARPVLGIDNAVAIYGDKARKNGYEQSYCALLETGDVKCWGYNHHGQIGTGASETHINVPTKPIIN